MDSTLFAFALIALGMALTPGPNMIYLISRSLCQGKTAGMVSLGGTALGFVFYMLCAAFGITALLMTIPVAYDVLKIAGALYLIYLGWKAIRSPHSPFEIASQQSYSTSKLFLMGFLTNLLNPKIAVMYLSLLPQFISPEHASVLTQSMVLGFVQIIVSVSVNAVIAIAAGSIAVFLSRRPSWLVVQRWLMGMVLTGLAIRMLTEARR